MHCSGASVLAINPFYFLIVLYFLANTYGFITIVLDGGVVLFGEFFEFYYLDVLVAYVVQLFFLLVIFLWYRIFVSKKVFRADLGDGWGYFLIIITVSYFVFNQVTGAGVAGSDFSFEGGNVFNYFFVLVRPDLWFLLVAPFLRSKRIFHCASVLFFISMLSRGWMGSVLLVFVIYLVRFYPVRINVRSFCLLFVVFAFVMACLPLLDALKWGLRSGVSLDVIVSRTISLEYFEVFSLVFSSVVDRLNNMKYVLVAYSYSEYFLDKILSGDISWFYMNGIFSSVYCKFFSCSTDIGLYFAGYLTGNFDISWNVDLGASGWFFVLGYFSPFFILYLLVIMSLGFWVFSKNYGERSVILVGCFTLIYLFHGWINAYFNFVLYGAFFYFFNAVKFLKNKQGLA